MHLKKFMKERGLTREQVKSDRNIEVPPLRVKAGLCKTHVLRLEQIN